MEFLNNEIIAIATTEGYETVLLINVSQIENESAKCVAYESSTKVASLIDNIGKAITFNAFIQVNDDTLASILIDKINRTQSDVQIIEINEYLNSVDIA